MQINRSAFAESLPNLQEVVFVLDRRINPQVRQDRGGKVRWTDRPLRDVPSHGFPSQARIIVSVGRF
jgi:hypothetical protein